MRIFNKLILVFLFFISIPVYFVSYTVFNESKNAIEKKLFIKLDIIADHCRKDLEIFLFERKADLLTLQHCEIYNPNISILNQFCKDPSNPLYIATKKELDRRLNVYQEAYGYIDIMLTNLEGRIIYVFNPEHETELGNTLSGKCADLQEVRKQFYVGDIHKTKLKNHPYTFYVGGPVYSDEEKIIGCVHLEIDLETVNKIVQENQSPEKSLEMVLVKKIPDNKIVFLSSLKYEKDAILNKIINIGEKYPLPAEKAVSGENGSGKSIDYRNKEVLAAWRSIPLFGWGLIVKIDSDEAFLPINRIKNILIFVAMITVLLATFAAFLIAKSISNPIHELHKGTEIIGNGNLAYKVGTDAKDEVGQLSRAFDDMTNNLRQTTTSLENLNKEITERKQAESYQILSSEILCVLNERLALSDAIERILVAIKLKTGFDAVGIRLKKDDDFPYFVQSGFSCDFLSTENTLKSQYNDNRVCCKRENAALRFECTCGLVLSGKTDSDNPLFTKEGSFWTNNSLELLKLSEEDDLRLYPRNRCIHENFLSIALIPIRTNQEIVGLLQLNDRRKDCFNLKMIKFFEGISASIGVALRRKLAEDELREREQRLRFHVENSPMAIIEWDMNFIVTRWAGESKKIFGWSAEETVGKPIMDLKMIYEEDVPAVQKVMEKLSSGKTIQVFSSNRNYNKKQQVIYCEWYNTVLLDPQGNMLSVMSQVLNITERKQLEESLHSSEERYRTIIEASMNGFWFTNLQGRLLSVNAAYSRMSGYSEQELLNMNISELEAFEKPEETAAHMKELITKGEERFESRHRRKDGSYFDVEINAQYRNTEGGRFEVFITDITERKKMEEVQTFMLQCG
ncbi:MAG: sensory box histidine kinase/response regulator, partial [uncultured bacterium]